jgi:hypothetical protein
VVCVMLVHLAAQMMGLRGWDGCGLVAGGGCRTEGVDYQREAWQRGEATSA